MLDKAAAQLALRNRARGVSVATTGSTTLVATATGYTRAAGSFVTDGFYAGMEVTPTGFTTNTADVITAVSATSITTFNSHSAQASGSGRTLAVSLPTLRAWEMVGVTPVAGKQYLEEEFIPATHNLFTMPAQSGSVEETGLYVLKWYGLPGYDVLAIRKCVDAILALFTPGTPISVGSQTLYVRGAGLNEPSPTAGQILRVDMWAVCTIRIPWISRTANVIAA